MVEIYKLYLNPIQMFKCFTVTDKVMAGVLVVLGVLRKIAKFFQYGSVIQRYGLCSVKD